MTAIRLPATWWSELSGDRDNGDHDGFDDGDVRLSDWPDRDCGYGDRLFLAMSESRNLELFRINTRGGYHNPSHHRDLLSEIARSRIIDRLVLPEFAFYPLPRSERQ